MKPAPFDYCRPNTLAEAVALLNRYGPEGRILAGGQSLMAMLNMRLLNPKALIDISRLTDADYIQAADDAVRVGCATRQCVVEEWPDLQEALPLLAQALPWVGHVQTRSRGTICGAIAHADPASELPLCLTVLNGTVTLLDSTGSRTVQGRQFFTGLLETRCTPTEMISDICFPRLPADTRTAFNEVAIRHGDFALISVAVIARTEGFSIGIGGTGQKPETRDWPYMKEAELNEALNDLAWTLDCHDDLHAPAAYRRQLIRTLGKRTLREAMA